MVRSLADRIFTLSAELAEKLAERPAARLAAQLDVQVRGSGDTNSRLLCQEVLRILVRNCDNRSVPRHQADQWGSPRVHLLADLRFCGLQVSLCSPPSMHAASCETSLQSQLELTACAAPSEP